MLRRFRGKTGEQQGFSLLEVMVAVGVLTIGLLALASLFSTSQRLLSRSHQQTLATNLAQNKMEELRSKRPFPVVKAEDTPEGMKREWSIIQRKDNAKLWDITVKVYPTEEPDQSVILQSMIFY